MKNPAPCFRPPKHLKGLMAVKILIYTILCSLRIFFPHRGRAQDQDRERWPANQNIVPLSPPAKEKVFLRTAISLPSSMSLRLGIFLHPRKNFRCFHSFLQEGLPYPLLFRIFLFQILERLCFCHAQSPRLVLSDQCYCNPDS